MHEPYWKCGGFPACQVSLLEGITRLVDLGTGNPNGTLKPSNLQTWHPGAGGPNWIVYTKKLPKTTHHFHHTHPIKTCCKWKIHQLHKNKLFIAGRWFLRFFRWILGVWLHCSERDGKERTSKWNMQEISNKIKKKNNKKRQKNLTWVALFSWCFLLKNLHQFSLWFHWFFHGADSLLPVWIWSRLGRQ